MMTYYSGMDLKIVILTSNEKEKESNKTEISELHKTVRQLEYLRKSDKQTIELLKKEQEKNNNFQDIK